MQTVSVAIVQRDNAVLLCQRKKDSRYGLQWEFPGGKVEPGESPDDCLHRELREELSVAPGEIDRKETMVSHYDDGSSYEVHYYFLRSIQGTPVNNVFEDIRWVPLTELSGYDILQGNAEIVRRLTGGLQDE